MQKLKDFVLSLWALTTCYLTLMGWLLHRRTLTVLTLVTIMWIPVGRSTNWRKRLQPKVFRTRGTVGTLKATDTIIQLLHLPTWKGKVFLNWISKGWRRSRNSKTGMLMLLNLKTLLSSWGSELSNWKMITSVWILNSEWNRPRKRTCSSWMRSWIKHWRERIWRLLKSRKSIKARSVKSVTTVTMSWNYPSIWILHLTKYNWLHKWMNRSIRAMGIKGWRCRMMNAEHWKSNWIRVLITSSTRMMRMRMMLGK